MGVTIQSIHFTASDDLLSFIDSKVGKLDSFYDDIVGSEVFLKLEKTGAVQTKVAEVKLKIPGKELFARKESKTFEEATDMAVDALKKQIEKTKAKR
jgi:putative sigma-54 modulation protein